MYEAVLDPIPLRSRIRPFLERRAAQLGNAIQGSYLRSILRPKRRFQIFGVGGPKTGTHSLANIFLPHYRSAHEPEVPLVVNMVLAFSEGTAGKKELSKFLINHDRRTWLEVNSSLLNRFLLEPTINQIPGAKFVLTIRDCYSWADSFFDDELNTPLAYMHPWRRLWRHFLKSSGPSYSKYERPLEERNLYTLDSLFSYWARHNEEVLSKVPPERLLVIRTDRISRSLDRIADFAGVPVQSLNSEESHSFKATTRHGILRQIDPRFVEEKANRYCGDLMARYFPKIEGPPHRDS